MRIKSIGLSWFRGAADQVTLDLDGKPGVVYGVNGSGKSSFVDAVEYWLSDGKIRHLAHEYSGKHQEKAVLNTHTPEGRKAGLSIRFADDAELTIAIEKDGSFTTSSADSAAMGTWDYRCTVLRQDEVAAFIHDTKGGKYSALLPLLGLSPLEVAAENLHRLAKSVEREASISEAKFRLRQVEESRKTTFGADSDTQILARIATLHATYCADSATTTDPLARCNELTTALDIRTSGSSGELRRHVALRRAVAIDLLGAVNAVRAASAQFAEAADPLIAQRVEILQSTGSLLDKLEGTEDLECPACGRSIAVGAFQEHIVAEQERLRDVIESHNTRKESIGALCDALKALKATLEGADTDSWRDELSKGPLSSNVAQLANLDPEAPRRSYVEADLKAIETMLLPLIDAAASAARAVPPDAQRLSTDKETVEAAHAVIQAHEQATAVDSAEALVSFIKSLEQGVRDEIRIRSQTIIGRLSADIQGMWGILHPATAIENVRLYVPKDAAKAIDIGLKFHGVTQESPRLTLSEGYRNSLGLCIFLAMAKREADADRPLFLDDVVVSLDRDHRGMIVELLQKEFGMRQVVILTHDREWYTELRQQLNDGRWAFQALLPYDTPDTGIRFSHRTTTFADARGQLGARPDSAGNDARKIMDIELAVMAERLQIRLPYLRGDKNDKRMAHVFLERFITEGGKCFQTTVGRDYGVYTDAIGALEEADRLLLSWGNRASHTFDLVRPEAAKLIDACEKALECFRCESCGRHVWFANAQGSEWVQCQCSALRWRYGKA